MDRVAYTERLTDLVTRVEHIEEEILELRREHREGLHEVRTKLDGLASTLAQPAPTPSSHSSLLNPSPAVVAATATIIATVVGTVVNIIMYGMKLGG